MKAGQESQTAVMVCMGRAMAHGRTTEQRYSDPTALMLLPDEARARVEQARSGVPPKGIRGRLERGLLQRQAAMMVARTVAIDDAIRRAATPQVVVLGAGLDGRAWRMEELRDATVFEVDHPDSQREKRARAWSLSRVCRDIPFLPVDFARDSLDEALATAGHDPSRPTTWVWEGVVMYLAREAIEATLSVVARRSARGSRLIVAYHSPSLMLRVVGPVAKRVGEPLRSVFSKEEMKATLARHRFEVVRDEDIQTIGTGLSPETAAATKVIRHLRIVTADRLARGWD